MRHLLLFLLIGLATAVDAQAVCEPFAGAPQPCQPFLTGVLTLPSFGVSQEFLHAQMLAPVAETSDTFVSLLDVLPTLRYPCAVAYARALCPVFFRPCNLSAGGAPVPVCRSVCTDYLRVCGADAPADFCDALDGLTGQPVFSTAPDCRPDNDSGEAAFVFPCPPPLRYGGNVTTDPDTQLPCALPCQMRAKQLVTTPRRYDDLLIAVSVAGWLSLASTSVLLAVYLALPQLRRYPARLVIPSAFGLWLVSVAYAGNSIAIPTGAACAADGVALSTSGWAAASGFLLNLGALLTATWWCIQMVVIFVHIGLGLVDSTWYERYEWLLHVWGWGYPLAAVLIELLVPEQGRGFGAAPGLPVFTTSYLTSTDLIWGVQISVLLLYIVVALVSIAAACWRVLGTGLRQLSKKRVVDFLLPLFGYGLWYLHVVVAGVALISYEQANQSDLAAGVADWYTCVFTSKGAWSLCQTAYLPNGILWWLYLSTAISGFVAFLFFAPLSPKVREAVRSSAIASESLTPVQASSSFSSGY